MMLYTKNGSIPQPETDGTDGWIETPDKPECPEGKQVVWLNWEWVIRDPKPEDRPGYQWNWQHDTKSWVEGAWPATAIEDTETIEEPPVPMPEEGMWTWDEDTKSWVEVIMSGEDTVSGG